MPETMDIDCPFCKIGKIRAQYKPPVYSMQRIRVGSNAKFIPQLTKEKYIVLSDCPNCGKTKKEIEKRLKEGKIPDREALLKRIKEQGLPTRI